MSDPGMFDEEQLKTATGRQLLARALQMYGQQPDVTALNEYAAQRQRQGRMDMLNSLAAQYAGKGFEPFQESYLKRSLAASSPEQFGDYGVVANGKFIADPYASRKEQASALFNVGKDVTADERASAREKAMDERAAARERAMDARAAANQAAQDNRYFSGLDYRQQVADQRQSLLDDQAREAARQRAAGADLVMGKVDEALGMVGTTTAGYIGKKMADNVPGTDAYALAQTIDTIKANLGFEKLAELRAASPTGGALGQVTERELGYLQNTVASLDNGLPASTLRRNLEQVRKHYENVRTLMDGKLPPEYQQGTQIPNASGRGGGSWTPEKERRLRELQQRQGGN